jgi:tetratricopeptide (TPR) repeat protein
MLSRSTRNAVSVAALGFFCFVGVFARAAVLDPEWTKYHERLSALAKSPPKDEYFGLVKENERYLRDMVLWLKAGAPYRKNGTWARKVTVFLDDTSGHRIKTVPDAVTFTTQAPAQITPKNPVLASNGEATVEIVYGGGQQTATVRVATVPPQAVTHGEFPLTGPGGQFGIGSQEAQPVDEAKAADRAARARDDAVKGKREFASRELFLRGRMFVAGNQLQRAADAFGECEATYPDTREAALCAWARMQTLRKAGQTLLANQLASQLVKKYPDSIPSQFATQQTGEVWIVPYF